MGIEIEYVEIRQDAANHLSLLIASGDYPDMMENFWGRYPGGPAQAILDDVILPLNDVFAESAPNISVLIDEMEGTARTGSKKSVSMFPKLSTSGPRY